MYTFIGIESLAANALIELLRDKNVRKVSFDTLVQYGMEIVRVFHRNTDEEAILLLSRQYQAHLINDYADFFEVEFDNYEQGVFKLKDGVEISELEEYFRWTLSADLLKAFTSSEALQRLGV